MHRFIYSLVIAIAGTIVRPAFAQDPYEEPVGPDEGQYDDSYGEEVPYDEADAPYDDYDVEPYGDNYDQPGEDVAAVDTFYDALAPYGRWVDSPDYGMVWTPSRARVGANFVPYSTGGSWQYTDVGWMFTTDFEWGWAPFHYGRWFRDARWGWVWVPGSVWAPAWVDWRFGGGYVGWAPLPPRHHRTVWIFAHARDIHRRHIHRYVVRSSPRYYRATAPIRHRVRSGRAYWYSGPRRDQVERVTRVRLRPVQLRPPRAGVVARVRVQGGRVREERVAPPRSRMITRSRRALPAERRQRPDMRDRRDVRQPDRGRDGRQPDRGPDRGRDARQPDRGDRRPDMRQPDRGPDRGRDARQPDRGHDARQPDRGDRGPDRGPDRQPDRGHDARQPDRGPDRGGPDRQPDRGREAKPDRQPDRGREAKPDRQPESKPQPQPEAKPQPQPQPDAKPRPDDRGRRGPDSRPSGDQPAREARERDAPKGDQGQQEDRRGRGDRGQGARRPSGKAAQGDDDKNERRRGRP